MPKAKSDQVITHRIGLQNTERELIETAILVNGASRSIVGIAQGVGAAVARHGSNDSACHGCTGGVVYC